MRAPEPPPIERIIDHRNRAVSTPSRATEMNPIATTPHRPPVAIALAMPPSSSPFNPRAARCIQNTIVVTIATARIDSVPPRTSCASKLSV